MRALTVYTHRADGQMTLAAEVTPADVDKGLGGRVGDFFVFTPGYRGAKWWERDAFIDQYERPTSHDEYDSDALASLHDEARAAIAELEPAEPPAAELTRETFTAAAADVEPQLIELRHMLLEAESRERDLLARIEALEGSVDVFAQDTRFLATEERVAKLELRVETTVSHFSNAEIETRNLNVDLQRSVQQLRVDVDALNDDVGALSSKISGAKKR